MVGSTDRRVDGAPEFPLRLPTNIVPDPTVRRSERAAVVECAAERQTERGEVDGKPTILKTLTKT